MLADLCEAKRRGCRIAVFKALLERGLQAFTDPQSPREMLTRTRRRSRKSRC
jgi:hypothetical protein